MTRAIRILLTCTGLALLGAGPVLAQSGGSVESRLSRMENEIQTLSRALFRGETPPPGSLTVVESATDQSARANIEVRLSQIEMDMRTLTGRVEEISFQVNQLQDKLERKLTDLEMRVGETEKSANAFPGQNRQGVYGGSGTAESSLYPPSPSYTPPPPPGGYAPGQGEYVPGMSASGPGSQNLGTLQGVPGEPLGAPPDSTDPAAIYESAFTLIRNQNFDGAERAFRGFLDRFPNHSLAPNALYWLGETHYVRGHFEAAARLFAEGYQKFPQGPKAADNLLKMGMSLAGMGNTKDACVALAQLQREFPNGAGPILGRADQEMARLNCPSAR
ncbi:MAG: tol-pal system protein YbgF [Alphaproteobacteria bacterium]|nr:tol-pal system protein YbgF [Alphaproteobacteria bacterium]